MTIHCLRKETEIMMDVSDCKSVGVMELLSIFSGGALWLLLVPRQAMGHCV
jgi:hypothetical protein